MFRAVGFQPVNPVLSNNYTWSYDNAGRLTSEVLDSSDNSLDQTESYIMDLVGNRIRRTIDKPGTANDVTDIYTFNSSDQLQSENRFSGLFPTGTPTGSSLQSTAYTWSGTQQTSKSVSVPSTSTVTQSMKYGLTGQLEGVITETKNGSNAVTARAQVEYRYDNSGLRFVAIDSTDSNLTTPGIERTENGRTEYLLDHANMTGYGQTIIETVKNALGQATKRTSYTIGTDEITQTVSTLDPATGNVTASETLTFGHDGHGSTRVLFGAAAAIAQVFTYNAYGELLAIHNGAGVRDATYGVTASTLANPAGAKTAMLYNGESFDSRIGQLYLRARWYDGHRFTTIDPFAGNSSDPLSFNKYGFVHGNPVMGIDPTGLEFSIGGLLAGMSIGSFNQGQKGAADTGSLVYVGLNMRWVQVAHRMYTFLSNVYDAYEMVQSILEFIDFDSQDLADMQGQIAALGSFLSGGSAAGGGSDAALNLGGGGSTSGGVTAGFETKLGIPLKKRGRVAKVLERAEELGVLNVIQERIGEAVTGYVAENLLGFKKTGLKMNPGPHGIDQLRKHSITGTWGVFEAKGGSSRLGWANYGGSRVRQMSGHWINHWVDDTLKRNDEFAPDRASLKLQRNSFVPMAAVVTRFDNELKTFQIKIGAKLHVPMAPHLLSDWPGF